MTLRINEGFEGANGVALATTNTTADSVFGSGTSTFDTSQFVTGASSARFTTTANTRQYNKTLTAASTGFFSFYIRPIGSLPSTNATVLQLTDTSTTPTTNVLFVVLNSNGTIKMQNQAAAIIGTATTGTVPVDQWSRLDVSYTAGGNVKVDLYPGDAAADSAVNTAGAGNTRSGTTTPTSYTTRNLGIGTASTATLNIDSFREDDTALPGPARAAALSTTVAVNPASGTVPFTVTATATASGGTGTPKTYAWAWGDGATTAAGSSATATHQYTTAGTYTVTVTVANT